jgi:hypothetical protein
VAQYVSRKYREHQSSVKAQLTGLGVDAEFFFQPDAFVAPLQERGLAKSLNLTMAELSKRPDMPNLLAQTATSLRSTVHDLRPVMKDFDQPVFADPAHMNETGARAVAEAIYAIVGPLLQS